MKFGTALLKIIFTFLFILFLYNIQFAQCPTLLWSDEFTGSTLNTSNWNIDIGGGGFGNNELQYYRSENLQVGGGQLTITAKQENYNGQNYTSSKITTAGKQYFTYGRFEARMKLPRTQGLWPAFWMLPQNWVYGGWPTSGEIDIMEEVGSNPYKTFGTIHYGSSVANHHYSGDTYSGVFDLSDDFHVYAVEWEPDTIKWFIDNHLFHIARPSDIAPDAWPFDQSFFMILNLAVGGNFGGNPDANTILPQTLEVDYVRVYSNPYTILITGQERVPQGSTKTYAIDYNTAATYNWTVPAGASITSGQGTGAITVQWGNTGGDITLDVTTASCGNFTFTKNVMVIGGGCDLVFEDFETNRNITLDNITGTSYNDASSNPSPSAINSSSTTGFYTRNTIQYDVMVFQIDLIDNSLEYENGNKVLYMDIYTNAPIGSNINLQLENKSKAAGSYPLGRRAVFVGTTTVQNQWQRIKFHLSSTPDLGTSPTTIDQLTILFRPNTYTSDYFYMDNLMSHDAATCGPLTSIMNATDVQAMEISPNPAVDKIKISMKNISNEPIRIYVTDMLGVELVNKSYTNNSSDFEENLDISSLPTGMYLLHLQQEGKRVASQKIVVY